MRNSTSTSLSPASFSGKDLTGLKFFKPLEKLLSRLHSEAAHPNRKLHYDGYISLLLLYFFNPIIKSLRDIQKVSELEKVAEDLGIRRASLGSLSEAAGVESDEIVWLGGQASCSRIPQKLRRIKVHVKNQPQHGLRPRQAPISRKAKSIRITHEEFDAWLITDRLDMPAETIALLYAYRWHIEIFFRWLKCTLGCRHLLAESENGIRIQMYAALIASLLVILWTGRKPSKTSWMMLGLYFQGWATLDELMVYIEKLKKLP